jgi:predicted nucleotidyltransferase
LFGSRANGNPRHDSDYDVMIVVNDDAMPEFKSSKLAYDVLWGIDASVDVLVWTKESFNKRVHIPNSLPAEILRSGERLNVA